MAAPGFRKEQFANLRTELPAQLPAYLKSQRWFGGKGREIRSTELVDVVGMQSAGVEAQVLYVNVEYQGGGADLYAVPVIATESEGAAGGKAAPVLRISGRSGGKDMVFTDALKSEAFLSLLLDAIQRGLVFRGESGEISTSHTGSLELQETGAAGSLRPRAIKAEQSNSSIAYGERLMLKLIRRLEPGVNPDLEMSGFLTQVAHYPHTPQLFGAVEYRDGEGRLMTQGILQAFVANQGDAWQYTMNAISSFYNEVATIPVERSGLPPQQNAARASLDAFMDSVGLLARRTAELHVALASDFGDEDFVPEPFDTNFQRGFERSVQELTKRVFGQLRQGKDRLPETVKSRAEEILSREQRIAERFHSALSHPIQAMRTRIHGDYHLGQVLYTGADFVIIDFEGEPARPLEERRLKRSPLQDAAGMLRSFHYAAYAPLLAGTGTVKIDASNSQNLNRWASAWAAWVSDRFLTEYLKVAGQDVFLPPTRAHITALLQIHVLEKAVYELGYELNNRPDWVAIPLEGISKALGT
jgi:maltose alpha-D-glucosyltransferase / alpha-amylase